MYYSNPYTIGETKIDKLSLLPFSEIMETYENEYDGQTYSDTTDNPT